MKRFAIVLALTLSQLACTQPPPQPAQPSGMLAPGVDQGPLWFRTDRAAFYSQDQGARIMPLIWIMALKQPTGEPFMADNLSRYGYLRNGENLGSNLPVGFTTNGPTGNEAIGMTCAACHTRQIEVEGTSYRIDGGPAIADFQSFLADLDTAVSTVLKTPDGFKDFAAAVLQGTPTAQQLAELRANLTKWFQPYHTIISRSLPTPAWGPSRLDAVGMIFNRLTGLDIGPAAQNYMIPGNIKRADSPTRYPFLWNASIQAKTQWPGFAANGNDLLALARNTGEVIGVFAVFHPTRDPNRPLTKIDYSGNNSANTDGLLALEDLIKKIGPPKYQWPIDAALAKQGEAIYNWPTAQGGCTECHGIKTGADPLTGDVVWQTPLQDVGTDSREYNTLGWQVNTGVLNGMHIPGIGKPLKPTDTAFNVLSLSVEGTILQRLGQIGRFALADDQGSDPEAKAGPSKRAAALTAAFQKAAPTQGEKFKYESRVMKGIWAVAPYLHNGSVPTLADLLNPVSERPTSFKIGPAYDPKDKVGLAVEQTKFDFTLKATGCAQRDSGASNCGHEFGTHLQPAEKKALLEYLKTL